MTPPNLLSPNPFPDWLTNNVRDVLARVQAGPEKDRWPGGEGAPDLIVLLLRAAVIPFAAVVGCAEAHAIPLPSVIEAHIGSELYTRYKQERGMGRGFSFMILGPDGRADYEAWLDRDSYVQHVIAQMQQDAVTAGVHRPERVMIFDDFVCEHGTIHTAWHLIQRAFPGAEIEVSVPVVESYQIVDALLPDLGLSKEEGQNARSFLYDLVKGYRETPSGLIPLDSPLQLERLGQQERHRKGNAYSLLANIYGEEQLLAFPGQVREAIRASGRTIDPASPPPPKTALLLTGAPGVGKTTVVQKTLALLPQPEGNTRGPDGFITVRNDHGYDLVSLNGKRIPVATTGEADFTDPVPVTPPAGSAVTVDREAVERMVGETLSLALLNQAAVIDEIGPLLMASDMFSDRIWWLLKHEGTLLGTITPHPHPFADRIKAHPAVELVEVTEENRDSLPVALAARLAERMQGRGPWDGLIMIGNGAE